MQIERTKELSKLLQMTETKEFSLVFLRGNEGMGKTELLKALSTRLNNVFYFAAPERNQKLVFMHLTREFEKSAPQSRGLCTSWETFFRTAAALSESSPFTLIFDDVQNIVRADNGFLAKLKDAISSVFSGRAIHLVLSGGSVSYMKTDIQGIQSPLFGLPSSSFELSPFRFAEFRKAFPDWSAEDQAEVYALTGGAPKSISLFRPHRSARENVLELIRNFENAPDPELPGIREPRVYCSILEAVASGSATQGEIARFTSEPAVKCGKYLNSLLSLEVLKRVPPCGGNPDGRRNRYEFSDPLMKLRFWLRTCPPDSEDGKSFRRDIRTFIRPALLGICREAAEKLNRRGLLPFTAEHLGEWWSAKDGSGIDIAAFSHDGENVLTGVFSPEPATEKTLLTAQKTLQAAEAKHFPGKHTVKALFSPSSADPKIIEKASDLKVKIYLFSEIFR